MLWATCLVTFSPFAILERSQWDRRIIMRHQSTSLIVTWQWTIHQIPL